MNTPTITPVPFGFIPGLTVFPNLQNLPPGNWSVDGSSTGGSSVGKASVAFNSPFPAPGSIALTSTGPSYNTQLFTQHPNSALPASNPLLITDVTVDAWIWIPSLTASPQALEGPNVVLYNGSHEMYPSIQADSVSKVWRLWNSAAGDWVPSIFPCAAFLAAKDQWQHIQVHYVFNSAQNQYMYEDLMVNGVPVFQHLGLPFSGAPNNGAVSIKTQVQIDNTASATAMTIYYGAITTCMWTAKS